MAEVVDLTATTSAGLSITGVEQVLLNPGEVKVLFLTLTPAAGTALNSTLLATITADFGGREQVMRVIPVIVAAPGVESISRAATSAAAFGNVDLASQLDDLGIAITNLTLQPASDVFRGQTLASLDSILTLLAVDPILVSFVDDLTGPRTPLAAALTEAEVLAALNQLGGALDGFGDAVFYRTEYNFELFLLPNSQVAQPQTPTQFELRLHHIGYSQAMYNIRSRRLAGVRQHRSATRK